MVSPAKEINQKCPDMQFTFHSKKNVTSFSVKASKAYPEKSRSLPFANRIFYLDLNSRKESQSLEFAIRSLGGVIAIFFDQSVTDLVSDRCEVRSNNSSLAHSPATSASPAGYCFSPSSADRSTLPRSRGAAMLERVSCFASDNYADPVSLALKWHIPVKTPASVRLEAARLQTPRETRYKLPNFHRPASKSKSHFVKIEFPEGDWKPELLKVDQWPVLDLDSPNNQIPFQWEAGHGLKHPDKRGTMTRRPYKHSSNSEEDSPRLQSLTLCNGHGPKRTPSHDDLKVQCNGLSSSRRGAKLLSPSGSDVLPLPSQRRSTRRASASWCGSTRELNQLSPQLSPTSPSDSELGVTLRPKGTLWLPVALIGTTAEEHGNSVRRRGGSDASLSSLDTAKPRRKKLSPEEKLLQDNKDYFKMEVLHTKLRSSDQKVASAECKRVSSRLVNGRTSKDKSEESADVDSFSGSEVMKVNGVKKQKRTRRSELVKLCDEAESFMFGESSRQSAASAMTGNGSDGEDDEASFDDDRPRRKRRSHTEAFLHDNADYYKFETPGSRLRGQGSLSEGEKPGDDVDDASSKESITFSFQAVPDTEPWYHVFQRQDEGNETIYPTLSDPANQLFLLPYEMPRPSASLRPEPPDYYAKRRIRLNNIISQSLPRKSPRCHASTLAILSSLKKRKRRSSGAPEADASLLAKDDFLSGSDEPIEEMLLLDPVPLDLENATPTRRKKTEERLTMCPAAAIPFENQSTDQLELLSSLSVELPDERASARRRGPKRRKLRINKTGWVKTRVRKIQKGKTAPANTGIETDNIIKSPRRTGHSPTTPPVSPCVVRVRKLSSTFCRKLSMKRKRKARGSSNDHSWATRRR